MILFSKNMFGQFLRYLLSGGTAFVLDFGSYFLLLNVGVWYVTANVVGNILGSFGAFLLHKYLVFEKKDKTAEHFVRYCIMNLVNAAAQTILLYMLVEYARLDEGDAKFLSWAITTFWNFFLYKFFVYV